LKNSALVEKPDAKVGLAKTLADMLVIAAYSNEIPSAETAIAGM